MGFLKWNICYVRDGGFLFICVKMLLRVFKKDIGIIGYFDGFRGFCGK